MYKLYVDTNLIDDEEKRKQEKESFEAEINDMIFTIDIRDMEVFELKNAEDLPILKKKVTPVL